MKYVVQFDDSEMEDLEAIFIHQKVRGSGVSVKKIGKNDQSWVAWKADLTKTFNDRISKQLDEIRNRDAWRKNFAKKMSAFRAEMGHDFLKLADFTDLKTLNSIFKDYFSFENSEDHYEFNNVIGALESAARLFSNRSEKYPHEAGVTLLAIFVQLMGIFAVVEDEESQELSRYVWDSDHPFRYQIIAKPVNEGENPKYYVVFSTAPKYIGD